MNPISSRINWAYQKNKHLIDSLVLRQAPEFVYKTNPPAIEGEIPVFTFHAALPDWFDQQCRHLVENGYKTLSSEEFCFHMTTNSATLKKTVLITFDDGLKHIWTVAYPILKKYGLHATCFLIPGCIPEQEYQVRPNLEDVWQGSATISDVMGIRKHESALATWDEIKIMHESGVVDFQSHTMHHAVVAVSDVIIDFVNPDYNPHYYGNIHIPLYTNNGRDITSREPLLGMPIYLSKPRMQAQARYFDDERLRMHCVEETIKLGERDFFKQQEWRPILRNVVNKYKSHHRLRDRYETPEERDAALLDELLRSKNIIEEKLPGKMVNQLCYPWYDANSYAIEASRKAGFKINYFGQRKGRVTNKPGDDPFEVVRVEDIFLERLPGNNRKSIMQTLKQLYELRGLPAQMFPDGRPSIG